MLPRTPARRYVVAAAHHASLWLTRCFPKLFPLVCVVGYPKSGTTWAAQLVADYFDLPLPRRPMLPLGFPAVIHGHEPVRPGYRHCVYVMRDGRDTLVSQYFALMRRVSDDRMNPTIPRNLRPYIPPIRDKEDVTTNLFAMIERQMTRPISTRLNWGRHVLSYLEAGRDDVALLRYEQLLADGADHLAQAVAVLAGEAADEEKAQLAIDRFAFARRARGRAPGEEDRNSSMRKGQAGDWRNHFTREIAELFDRHAGEALVAAGYEPDRTWVQSVPTTPPARAVGAGVLAEADDADDD
ncbi:MAG: sulfotransferase domain-containing protein [Phycisphaeraceae bacterium]